MENSAPPPEVLASLGTNGTHSASTPKAAPPAPAALEALRAQMTGQANLAMQKLEKARQQRAAAEAHRTIQLKQEAYQLDPDRHGNSVVMSRTSHGGTESNLLLRVIQEARQRKMSRRTQLLPHSTPKGPAAQGGTPKPSMISQMNMGHEHKPQSSPPAAHELPLGE